MSTPLPPEFSASRGDIAERIVRLETKLDFLIAQMDKLPPSPACVGKHAEFEERFNSIESWRNRAMGAILIVNILVVVFMDKIRGLF